MELLTIVWLALLVGFLVVEASTVTLISLWFAAGALAALIAALLHAQLWLQVVVFFAVSAALLACLRPLVSKHFTPRLSKTNLDAVIGSEGYVTVDIDNLAATGTVKLGAMEWTARSADGHFIKAGTCVKVEKIEGVKVFVTAVPAEAPVC